MWMDYEGYGMGRSLPAGTQFCGQCGKPQQ